jgi:uncharacterized repeat protein (TIGR03803 family)
VNRITESRQISCYGATRFAALVDDTQIGSSRGPTDGLRKELFLTTKELTAMHYPSIRHVSRVTVMLSAAALFAVVVPGYAASARLSYAHSFTGSPDGAVAEGGVVRASDGALYGVTTYGGIYGLDPVDGAVGNGSIFKHDSAGNYSVVYSFTPLSSGFSNVDGRWPDQPLVASQDGVLYGVTPYGGANDGGVVFRFDPASGFTTLHTFGVSGSDPGGTRPTTAPTLGSDGMVYGTTEYGGTEFPNDGVAFKMKPDGSNFSVLQSFGQSNNILVPEVRLLQTSDGLLYGLDDYAHLFRMATDGSDLGIVHRLDYPTEGCYNLVGPMPGMVEAADGSIYVLSPQCGPNGAGVLTKIASDGSQVTVLHSFGAGQDGVRPTATLQMGPDGNLYGATMQGGSSGTGTVFRIGPDGGNYEVVYNFPALSRRGINRSGAYPSGDIAFGTKGRLCGTTLGGGASAGGVLYCLRITR